MFIFEILKFRFSLKFFGLATSLGFGAQQAAGGIHYLFQSVPNNITTQLAIIFGVTVIALFTVYCCESISPTTKVIRAHINSVFIHRTNSLIISPQVIIL